MRSVEGISAVHGGEEVNPGVGSQLGPQGWIGDKQKFPGLQAIAGGALHQAVLQAGPGVGVDAAAWIECLHRIAPLQRCIDLGGGDWQDRREMQSAFWLPR